MTPLWDPWRSLCGDESQKEGRVSQRFQGFQSGVKSPHSQRFQNVTQPDHVSELKSPMSLTAITLNDLKTAIVAAIATGRAGEIVSVRLHWPLSDTTTAERQVLIAAVDLIDVALNLGPTRWRLRRAGGDRLLHLHGVDDRGRTAVVTVTRGFSDKSQLTVFGNHGIVRLDQADLQDDVPSANPARPRPWLAGLDEASAKKPQ